MSTGVMWTWILAAGAFLLLAVVIWLWVAQDPQPTARQVDRNALNDLRAANAARLEGIADAVVTMQKAQFDLHPPRDDNRPEPVASSVAPQEPGVDQIRTVRLARAADVAAGDANGVEYRGLHGGAES